MRLLPRAIAAVLVTVVLAAPASSPAKSTAARGFVGTVRGTHAFVGVAVSGSHVTAYVCDSKRIAQWFTGSLHAATVTLTSCSMPSWTLCWVPLDSTTLANTSRIPIQPSRAPIRQDCWNRSWVILRNGAGRW